jgi:hypothetical protein
MLRYNVESKVDGSIAKDTREFNTITIRFKRDEGS